MGNSQKTVTLKDVLVRSAKLYGPLTAFHLPHRDGPKIVTYQQFVKDVDALGTVLFYRKKKMRRIGIIGSSSYEWGLAYLATMNGSGVAVPLDKELTAKELRDSIKRVKIDTLFYSENVAQKVQATKSQGIVKTYISMEVSSKDQTLRQLVDKGAIMIEDGNYFYRETKIDPDEMSSLLFTSGTTSRSKIVMLSHRNITSNLINGSAPYNLTTEDTFLSILPMHHMFECTAGFLAPIYSGCSIFHSQGIRYIGQELRDQQPTIVVCVPRILDVLSLKIWKGINEQHQKVAVVGAVWLTNHLGKLGVKVKKRLFARIHREVGGRIRFFLSGAAAINHATASSMTGFGFNIYQGYGLTECSPAVTVTFDGSCINSVGTPIAGTEVSVLDQNAEGVGEIAVRGPQVMLGYYRDRKATSRAMQNGYFRTGDLGHFQENGSLRIIGRLKNVIITSGGKKIYPEEIESLLNQCAAIKDAIVYGEEHSRGVKVCVSLVLTDSDSKKGKNDIEKDARTYVEMVNADLAEYEKIRAVKIRETDFVRTSTLKVKRRLL